jgi:hypothetical protein
MWLQNAGWRSLCKAMLRAENTKLDFREKGGFSVCRRTELDVFSGFQELSPCSADVKNVLSATSAAPDIFVAWC